MVTLTLSAKPRIWTKFAILSSALTCALLRHASERAATALGQTAGTLIATHGVTIETVAADSD